MYHQLIISHNYWLYINILIIYQHIDYISPYILSSLEFIALHHVFYYSWQVLQVPGKPRCAASCQF